MIYECRVKLGDKVKDTITGFEGVAAGIVFHLNGCVRVSVQPTKLKKEGGTQESEWIDVEQIKVLAKAKAPKRKPAGGPMAAPRRTKDPK